MKTFKTRSQTLASLRMNSSAQALKAGGAVLGLSAAMLIPAHAYAQQAVEKLPTVKVEDTAIDPNPNAELGVPYKAKTSGDERHTRPLAETPQTISVLTKAQIDDSGYTDLKTILNAQPGITVGTGENGNAFGDRYIIRGQEARSDVFVDGLRDPGMTTRESFVIEQLEITKGPNSSFAGRGTSGGAINAITKQATTSYNFAKASVGVGTDQFTRVTADVNHSFGETVAVRANVLYSYEEVPYRHPADRERKGAAVSGYFAPTDNLNVTLDYYGLRASDNPDVGGYLVNKLPAPNVPTYAQKQDFQDSDVNTFTARIKYEFSPTVRVTNLSRYGTSDNGYVVSGGHAGTTGANNPGGAYSTTTLTAHQGWQEVKYFANQTNLFANVDLLGLKNEFVVSFEYTNHKVLNGVYNVTNLGAFNCITGTGTVLNNYCVTDANGQAVNNINTLLNRKIVRGNWDIDWKINTKSASIMDTIDITERLSAFVGVRMDSFNYTLGTQNTTSLAKVYYPYSDTLWNGHAGLTYKFDGGVMVYASYASAADINGGESDVGTSSGYGGAVIYNGQIAGASPERSNSIEIGTKWNAFDEKILLTAAVFQNTKKDVMEGADYAAVGTFNTGKNRIRGVEFGASGNITDALTVQAGLSFLKSEVLASSTPASIGKMLSNVAEKSAVLQAKYQFTEKFNLGGAVKYESARYGGQPDTAAVYSTVDGSYSQPVPAYTVFDVFATYRLNKTAELRLNVNNVGNKEYYLAVYRAGFFLYKGDGRTAKLTLNLDL